MQDNINCLIIGQGKIGVSVTNQIAQQGHHVSGLARGERKQYVLSKSVTFIQADATKVSQEKLLPYTHITIIVSPSERGEQGYRNSYLAIAKHISSFSKHLTNLQRIIFISSTGIYGQDSGEWIDEFTSPKLPERITSQVIYQAEQHLIQTFEKKCIIIRPSGIYGTERLMRVRNAKEATKPALAECAWTNRVMDVDLVNIIVNVMFMDNPRQIYLATDYTPCTSYELIDWLSNQLNTNRPTVDLTLPASGKRIHSNIPLEWLRYPDWKSGYAMILKNTQ